jgi:alpha-glucosidase
MTEPTHSPGDVASFAQDGRSVVFDCGGPRVEVTILSPTLGRVRLAPDGTFAPRRSWAVARADEEFTDAPFTVRETAGAVEIDTGALVVKVERAGARVSFSTPNGQEFCADGEGMRWGADGRVSCAKRIEAGEHFYGFGERTGQLDKLGRYMINWTTDPPWGHGPGTDPLYIAIPVFMALRPGLAYGVFFNNTWRSHFDIGATRPGSWSMTAAGGELDYYLMYGVVPESVSEQIGQLLGTMPLPPLWALGYHQSRWGYTTEAMVREVAAEFRRRDLPCDVVHFDIDYMDGYRVFTWHPERFPDQAALLADLRRDNFRAVTIIDPGVKADPAYDVYRDGLERDMFIRRAGPAGSGDAGGEVFHGYVWPDDSVFADFTRPDVRAWWGDRQRALVDAGVSGIWNDMNEPAVFELPFSQGGGDVGTIDLDAPQGPEGDRTTHAEVHNMYGYGMARASYEGLRRDLGGERPFVLTRSGYAGIQRWSACWMGDNSSMWEHLELTMPQLMNMGLSGVPFVGTDVGGFFGNATGEMFARWMQLGVLTPFCRGHSVSGSERHEPWVFGPEIEAICRDYLRLRYRLLPYTYSLFWQASQRGTPLLRPLLYHFSDDPGTYQIHDQVMLGPFLMAAPVYHPGRDYRSVYLPQVTWFDWWTEEELAMIGGPGPILARAPLERLPLYVRAGAIIPSGPDLRYTGERPLDQLTLDLFPGDGEFTLYEDDGHTFGYERGEFCTTRYTLRLAGDTLTLAIDPREGNYTPAARRVLVRVRGPGEWAPDGAAEFEDNGSARVVVFQRH